MVLSIHTVEGPVREDNSRPPSPQLVVYPERLRSAETVDLETPGNFSHPSLYFPHRRVTRPHRDAVQQGHAYPCVECRKQPQAIGDVCLGYNGSIRKSSEPQLRELSLQDPKAASLIDHFHHQWKGSEPVKIGKVYEIRLPRNITKAHDTYYSKLAKLERPRQIQTFHGTQCICDLGTNKTQFCTWQSCGACAIIKSAFRTFEFGVESNTGQFGSGVYSYLEPSLADRHAVSTTSSPYRTMFSCEVRLPSSRVQPPKLSGIVQSHEVGPSVFVSGAEAITPKHLILYSKPPTTSPKGPNSHSICGRLKSPFTITLPQLPV